MFEGPNTTNINDHNVDDDVDRADPCKDTTNYPIDDRNVGPVGFCDESTEGPIDDRNVVRVDHVDPCNDSTDDSAVTALTCRSTTQTTT